MPVGGVRLSLWRALTAFRVTALAVDVYLIVRWQPLYRRPGLGLAVAVAMVLTTAVVGRLAVRGRAHRPVVVLADAVVTYVLTVLSLAVQTPPQAHGGMVTLTTIWAAGPTIGLALLGGPFAGIAAGLAQFSATVAVAGTWQGRTLYSGVLLVIVGAAVGLVVRLAVRAETELQQAAAARAALAERERLARSIHDGVLQVLALVHRTGAEQGGRWAALAGAAAEQEAALRGLITSHPASGPPRDLSGALAALGSSRVTVSTPATPVTMVPGAVGEIVDAVRAALRNVEQHAGDAARAWVLLESLDDAVRVTIRDDGVGIAPGRADDAARDGRIGLARSVRGRIEDLGGTCAVTSAPGAGTEIELTVPAAATVTP